jgi:hypothetical protein
VSLEGGYAIRPIDAAQFCLRVSGHCVNSMLIRNSLNVVCKARYILCRTYGNGS